MGLWLPGPKRNLTTILNALVGQGVLEAVAPSTDTGWERYPDGMREFLPAATNYFQYPDFALDTNADGIADGSSLGGTVQNAAWSIVDGGQRFVASYTAGDSDVFWVGGVSTAASSFAPGETATAQIYISELTATEATIHLALFAHTVADAYIGAVYTGEIVGVGRTSKNYPVLPADTSRVRASVQIGDWSSGSSIDITFKNEMIEKSSVLTPYFDGSYDDCAWTGTAHASTSTRTISVLTYPTANVASNSEGTFAARFAPLYAGSATLSISPPLYAIRNSADTSRSATLYFHGTNRTYNADLYDGTNNPIKASGVQSFAANTLHHAVMRYSTSWLNLNVDGTDAAAYANDATLSIGTYMTIGVSHGKTISSHACMGPCIHSPADKGSSWTTAIQAGDGAAYSDVSRLVNEFMAVNDLLMPFNNGPTAYRKVA